MSFLTPNDPPSFCRFAGDSQSAARAFNGAVPAAFFIADHAGIHVPQSMADAGIDDKALSAHISHDIGVMALVKAVNQQSGLSAIAGNYSRLIIDLNRPLDDPTSIRAIYDGHIIRGNFGLSAAQKQARHDGLFYSYHNEISKIITSFDSPPAIISLHSCSPFGPCGTKRPWHIGILSNQDRAMADHALGWFARTLPDYVMGDNLPYSGFDAYGYSLETHALPAGLPHILFEIRHDLLKQPDSIDSIAAHIISWLGAWLDDTKNGKTAHPNAAKQG